MTFKEAFNSGCRFRIPKWGDDETRDYWLVKVDDKHFKSVISDRVFKISNFPFYNGWTDWEINQADLFNKKLEELE